MQKKLFVIMLSLVVMHITSGHTSAQTATNSATNSGVVYTETSTSSSQTKGSTTSGQVTMPDTLPQTGVSDGLFTIVLGLFLLGAGIVARSTLLSVWEQLDS